jgi:FKBP-type peptidyl-prolyl cis-trans isomerase
MRISTVLFGLLLLLCVACDTVRETPRGWKYKVIKAGDGVLPKPNDVMILNFRLVDEKDSVWNDTYTIGMPVGLPIRDTSAIKYEDDMMQILRQSSAGDSLAISFSLNQFFAKFVQQPIPVNLDSAMKITYYLKVDSITTQELAYKLQLKLSREIRVKQLGKDLALIDEYLAANNINAVKIDSGMRYVITKPGTGENCKSGQIVSVDYIGTFLDGKCFDTSNAEAAKAKGVFVEGRPYEPYEVTIDRSSVIRAWHQGLKLLNKGAKATFYIPSEQAYGSRGRGAIKPNTVLVFDIEIVDVKDPEINKSRDVKSKK